MMELSFIHHFEPALTPGLARSCFFTAREAMRGT